MYYVYVLYSLKDDTLYKGSTSDISKRLLRYNSGQYIYRPPKTICFLHIENFLDKTSALKWEFYIKSAEGGFKLKEFLRKQNILNEDNLLNTKR